MDWMLLTRINSWFRKYYKARKLEIRAVHVNIQVLCNKERAQWIDTNNYLWTTQTLLTWYQSRRSESKPFSNHTQPKTLVEPNRQTMLRLQPQIPESTLKPTLPKTLTYQLSSLESNLMVRIMNYGHRSWRCSSLAETNLD
jgi:hypothetical protein